MGENTEGKDLSDLNKIPGVESGSNKGSGHDISMEREFPTSRDKNKKSSPVQPVDVQRPTTPPSENKKGAMVRKPPESSGQGQPVVVGRYTTRTIGR